eukprot:361670-Chlamydomonas_euryale.AAC.7
MHVHACKHGRDLANVCDLTEHGPAQAPEAMVHTHGFCNCAHPLPPVSMPPRTFVMALSAPSSAFSITVFGAFGACGCWRLPARHAPLRSRARRPLASCTPPGRPRSCMRRGCVASPGHPLHLLFATT